MASKPTQTVGRAESLWREFPAMTGYFAPGIVPLLKYLELDSSQVMHEFGEQVGRMAAAKMANLSLDQMLDELAEIGSLSVGSRNPMIIQISNCTVCGQLNGTGEMFECAFHEGFFQGALSARLGKPVKVSQETNYAGDAGTWCRRLAVDVPWPPRWLRQIGQRRRYPKAVAE